MRIRVKADGVNLWIPLPLSVVCSGASAGLIEKALQNTDKCPVSFNKEQIRHFFRAVRQYRKAYPGLVLVDVQAADGTVVKITL